MYVCMSVCLYVYMYVCMYVCMFVCMYAWVYAYFVHNHTISLTILHVCVWTTTCIAMSCTWPQGCIWQRQLLCWKWHNTRIYFSADIYCITFYIIINVIGTDYIQYRKQNNSAFHWGTLLWRQFISPSGSLVWHARERQPVLYPSSSHLSRSLDPQLMDP